MKICIFASGSSGNCLLISENGTNILIDAGISLRRTEAALTHLKLSMKDIAGVLITHEHSDHICALRQITKKYGTGFYAPHTVANRISAMLPETADRFTVIPVDKTFKLGSLEISAFHTSHDTDESVGYRVEGEGIFALATDTGCVTEGMINGLTGAGTVLIESNHDVEMLINGPYPLLLKRRILSEHGHLSNEACADLAAYLADNGTKTVVLGHISKMNNTPQTAYSVSERRLAGSDVKLLCAPESGELILETGEGVQCLQ